MMNIVMEFVSILFIYLSNTLKQNRSEWRSEDVLLAAGAAWLVAKIFTLDVSHGNDLSEVYYEILIIEQIFPHT